MPGRIRVQGVGDGARQPLRDDAAGLQRLGPLRQGIVGGVPPAEDEPVQAGEVGAVEGGEGGHEPGGRHQAPGERGVPDGGGGGDGSPCPDEPEAPGAARTIGGVLHTR
jgi:hypothetical protein